MHQTQTLPPSMSEPVWLARILCAVTSRTSGGLGDPRSQLCALPLRPQGGEGGEGDSRSPGRRLEKGAVRA